VYIVYYMDMVVCVWIYARVWDFRVERRMMLFEIVPLGASVFDC
jgi:hypothetical protein